MAEQKTTYHRDPYNDAQRYDSIEGLVGQYLNKGETVSLPGNAEDLYKEGLLLNFRKEYQSALSHLERALYLFQKEKNYAGQAKCLVELGWLKYNEHSDGLPKAIMSFDEASGIMAIHQKDNNFHNTEARLLHYKGLVKYREHHYGEGVRYFREALAKAEKNSLEAAQINDSLAIYYERTGNFSRGVDCLERSFNIKKALNNRLEEAITAQILGRMCLVKEDFDQAEHYLTLSLSIVEPLNDIRRIVSLKNQLIKMYIQQEQFEEASTLIKALQEQLKGKERFERELGITLMHQCLLMYKQKQYTDARKLIHEDLTPFLSEHQLNKSLGKAYRLSAQIDRKLLDSGDAVEKAIEKMGQAMALFREKNLVDEQAKTHYEFGKLYNTVCETQLALDSFLEGLKIAEANGLTFIAGYIEDQIYITDINFWQEIVDKRAKHQRIFEDDRTLLDALAARVDTEETQNNKGDDATNEKRLMVSLLKVGQAMSGERDLEKLLLLIMDETQNALTADRCTVFMYDSQKNELWSRVGAGLDETQEIRFPAHMGLAGYVCKTGEILNIPNAYKDPRFNPEVDKQTGYKTENILCMPMRNRDNEIIGVFQVLNKQGGPFTQTDEELLIAITSQAGVTLENAQLAKDQNDAFQSFVKTLSSTIAARDHITSGHSARGARYSDIIGVQMHLNTQEKEILTCASLLHDIGKIGIKEDVLTKDGRLTEKEYRHIQKHAEYTYDILKNIHFEKHLKRVPEIAAVHHEKMDGTGYFRGLKGAEIPLLGRILALSDVFDAITSHRHYRNRMPFERVLKILRKDAGSHFDPDCVEAFFNSPLANLGHVLMMEYEDGIQDNLIKPVHISITVREFDNIMSKDYEERTAGEKEIQNHFSKLYNYSELDTVLD